MINSLKQYKLRKLINNKNHVNYYEKDYNKYFFIGFIISLIIIIKESTSPIPNFLAFLKPILIHSNYNQILFTLASGYLIAFLIWYFDIYLPKKRKREFAYGTLFLDYNTIIQGINKYIISYEKEIGYSGFFLEKGIHAGILLSQEFNNPFDKTKNKPIIPLNNFKVVFDNEIIDIKFSLDKILIYNDVLPMHEINSASHLRHYLHKIEYLLNKKSITRNEWLNILGLLSESLRRAVILLKKGDKLKFNFEQDTYLYDILKKHNSDNI